MSTTRFGADREGTATVLREICYRARAMGSSHQARRSACRGAATPPSISTVSTARCGPAASAIELCDHGHDAPHATAPARQAQAAMSALAFAKRTGWRTCTGRSPPSRTPRPTWRRGCDRGRTTSISAPASTARRRRHAASSRSIACACAARRSGHRRRRALPALLQPGSPAVGAHAAAAARQVLGSKTAPRQPAR